MVFSVKDSTYNNYLTKEAGIVVSRSFFRNFKFWQVGRKTVTNGMCSLGGAFKDALFLLENIPYISVD